MKAIHKKTGNLYKIVTDNFMFKKDGVWIKNLVLYEALYPNPDGKYFARTKEDFNEHFETYDEKIREEIIKLVKFYYGSSLAQTHSVSKDDMIAWLEKQGESDETKAKIFLISKGYPIDANGTFPTYEEMYNIIREGLEHQGDKPQGKTALEAIHEEKVDNTNKVEPKFHEDTWVVNNNSGDVFQVTEIEDDEYCLWPLDAEIMGHLRIIDVDNEYHLWTIEDAKDGDVLASGNNMPFIYNGHHDYFFSGSYCGISVEGNFRVSELNCHWTEKVNVHPATKEQRAVLFQKMREAGYEWDKTKKELKEIEKQGERKWSERDDKNLAITIGYLQGFPDDLCEMSALIKWLKGLKERIK